MFRAFICLLRGSSPSGRRDSDVYVICFGYVGVCLFIYFRKRLSKINVWKSQSAALEY